MSLNSKLPNLNATSQLRIIKRSPYARAFLLLRDRPSCEDGRDKWEKNFCSSGMFNGVTFNSILDSKYIRRNCPANVRIECVRAFKPIIQLAMFKESFSAVKKDTKNIYGLTPEIEAFFFYRSRIRSIINHLLLEVELQSAMDISKIFRIFLNVKSLNMSKYEVIIIKLRSLR